MPTPSMSSSHCLVKVRNRKGGSARKGGRVSFYPSVSQPPSLVHSHTSLSSGRDWRKRERGTLDDPLGGYALTLVDSLDTLAVMGDYKA